MIGHQPLIDMRRRGAVPAMGVEFDFGPVGIAKDWHRAGLSTAYITLTDTDRVERLDLRFVVGMDCWVSGEVDALVWELADALKQAGAKKVAWVINSEQGTVAMGDDGQRIVWHS